MSTITDDDGNEYHLIIDMPKLFPHFCETQCCAWDQHSNRCLRPVMSQTHCARPVLKIKQRILDWAKVNGDKWWKKKVVVGKKDVGSED